jgi:signal transduction protein with GAF and PtsI domain
MGYDVLSMNSTNLLLVKHALSQFALAQGKSILGKVLEMDNAYLIKNFVDEEMHKAGLGNIVRSRRYG